MILSRLCVFNHGFGQKALNVDISANQSQKTGAFLINTLRINLRDI